MRNMTEEHSDQVIDVHLKGCWNGTRLAAGIMREQKPCSILNIFSPFGRSESSGPLSTLRYGAW